jgi:hypothetical protein
MHTSVYASPLPTVQNTPYTATKYSSTRSTCAPTYANEKSRLIDANARGSPEAWSLFARTMIAERFNPGQCCQYERGQD